MSPPGVSPAVSVRATSETRTSCDDAVAGIEIAAGRRQRGGTRVVTTCSPSSVVTWTSSRADDVSPQALSPSSDRAVSAGSWKK